MLSVKCWALPANCAQKAGDKVPGCLSLPWPLLSPFPPASLWPHPPRRLRRPPSRHPMAVTTIISILYESFNPEGQARHLLFPFER